MRKLILIVVVKTLASSIITTKHSCCKLESANVSLTFVGKSNLIESFVKKIDTLSLTVKKQNVISF